MSTTPAVYTQTALSAEFGVRPAQQIRFTVFGHAATAGSKRAFVYKDKSTGAMRAAVTDDCKQNKSWQWCVATAAREAYQGPLLEGPLCVRMIFYLPRPKAHFSTRGPIKPKFVDAQPTTRPDLLKRARSVEDALTKILWGDDSQIVSELLAKRYGEPERVEIVIEPL